jgi:hypothetical protein
VNVTEAFIEGWMQAREMYGIGNSEELHGAECQKAHSSPSFACTCDEDGQRREARMWAPRPKRPLYKFVGRDGGRYTWQGPTVDSRSEIMTCSVAWFWGTPPR